MSTESSTPEYRNLIEALGLAPSNDGGGVLSGDSLRDARTSFRSSHLLDKHFRYASVLDTDNLGVTDVFEVNGTPCIYFKSLSAEPTAEQIHHWHRTAWNHGLGRMLWIVTPKSLRVLNAFHPPPEETTSLPKRHPAELLQEATDDLEQIRKYELDRIGLESGQFWTTKAGRKINKATRIDEKLAADLGKAAQLLTVAGCDPLAAHRLMLRTMFTAYLEARGVLPNELFADLKSESFKEVLTSVKETQAFFEGMRTTFNGDLFPPPPTKGSPNESYRYAKPQLEIARSIVIRRDLTSGQLSLDFWRYDFEIIPIELISSIYERFIYAGDPKLAKERGTHYTPVNLVDLVFSQVFDDGLFSEPLSDKPKVLDLACGSGVFLVDAFRRLVARRVAEGKEKLSRTLVRDVLAKQLFGVDLEETAIEIAAFSLCLTAFELDPSPDSIKQLKFKDSLKERNLFVGDAFQSDGFAERPEFKNKQFSIVVGNPPWKKTRGSKTSAETSAKSHIAFCDSLDPPVQLGFRSPIDQAFIWRSQHFCDPGGRIGLIVDAKNFFSPQPQSQLAKQDLFGRMRPRVLLNLSSHHNKELFPSAEQPAMIFVAENTKPTVHDEVTIASTERSERFRKHGIVELFFDRVNSLSFANVRQHEYLLKLAINGGPRDFAILKGLYREFSTVGDVLDQWGTALMPGYKGRDAGADVPKNMVGMRMLEDHQLELLYQPTDSLPKFEYERMHRPRDLRSYLAPLAIVPQGLSGNRLAATTVEQDVIYARSYSGMPVGHPFQSQVLACFFNSSLAAYCFLHTASRFGIDRQIAEQNDFARLPFRDFDTKDDAVMEMVRLVAQARRDGSFDDFAALDTAVFDFFSLENWQRDYVTDVVNVDMDFVRNGTNSDGCNTAEASELASYADTVCSTIRGNIGDTKLKVTADIIEALEDICAVVIRFDESRNRKVQTIARADFNYSGRLAELLHSPLTATFQLRRSLVYFDGDRCIIVKLSQKRFWSRARGYDDADSILAELVRP
ncbi:N-6 DNA methylase [Planctomycetes bacterium TBK1r]|uniref:site-specific DNA-methyltransferase (adenine-specific) n=1 Tax=Stieleria magnilauensis TaxID=2527963 RepID=A0ABX5XWW1_9BACT|nr:Type IIS restriction enzyme Eco57I [Planctomycetes bacterium TBK1r]